MSIKTSLTQNRNLNRKEHFYQGSFKIPKKSNHPKDGSYPEDFQNIINNNVGANKNRNDISNINGKVLNNRLDKGIGSLNESFTRKNKSRDLSQKDFQYPKLGPYQRDKKNFFNPVNDKKEYIDDGRFYTRKEKQQRKLAYWYNIIKPNHIPRIDNSLKLITDLKNFKENFSSIGKINKITFKNIIGEY